MLSFESDVPGFGGIEILIIIVVVCYSLYMMYRSFDYGHKRSLKFFSISVIVFLSFFIFKKDILKSNHEILIFFIFLGIVIYFTHKGITSLNNYENCLRAQAEGYPMIICPECGHEENLEKDSPEECAIICPNCKKKYYISLKNNNISLWIANRYIVCYCHNSVLQ